MYTPPKEKWLIWPRTEKAQLTFSSNDVRKVSGKLDAPHLVLVTIISFVLVVSPLTIKLISVTVFFVFFSPRSEVPRLRTINFKILDSQP